MDAFLETTAMVDLLIKDRMRVRSINAVLTNYNTKYSSEYVRMEIKRGVLNYFVCLYNKSVECTGLSEVFAYTQRLASTPARHKLGTILEAVSNFFKTIETTKLTHLEESGHDVQFQKKMFEAFLRTRIRQFWHRFETKVDVVSDSVECYKNKYTLLPPKLVGTKFDNTFDNCDMYKPGICRIRELLNEKAKELESIKLSLEHVKDPDVETRNRLRALKQILRLRKRQIPRQQCWWAGDAVVILDAPEDAVIINHNPRHFEPICHALNRRSISY